MCTRVCQAMRSLISSSLQNAHNSSRTSIAIPAIGTGNLRVPADIACWIMYDEVDKFSQNNASTSLKDVRFVVYDKDQKTIDVRSPAFLSVMLKMGLSGSRHYMNSVIFSDIPLRTVSSPLFSVFYMCRLWWHCGSHQTSLIISHVQISWMCGSGLNSLECFVIINYLRQWGYVLHGVCLSVC